MALQNQESRENLMDYSLHPLVIDAKQAHKNGVVCYNEDGTVIFCHPDLSRYTGSEQMVIGINHQFSAIRATFDDLNKPLSRLSNSPLLEGGQSLRSLYEEEVAHYEQLVETSYATGQFEPDYGSYVLDHARGELYLIAPERWHRLGLVTSNAMLLTDPEGKLSWREVRERLENAVIGFAGVSVGSNLVEGWLREARPRSVKIADPDWVELTNFNRGERLSLRHLVGHRGQKYDARNPYEVPRVSKAELVAYESQLIDPYVNFWVYKDGLNRGNIDQFLAGDGQSEPPLDILVEEMDNLDLKVSVREAARTHRIDVLMMSDFGHCADMLWNYFRAHPDSSMGLGGSDDQLKGILAEAKTGDRKKIFEFIEMLCGPTRAGDSFDAFVEGRGEQPTSSLPQSGATAMASGAIGGKELALHILGHHQGQSSPCRVTYDLALRALTKG